MNSDQNELFPDPPEDDAPQDGYVEPDDQMLDELIDELTVDEMVEHINTIFTDHVIKFLLEFALTLINPTEKSRESLFSGIIVMTASQVEREVSQGLQEADTETVTKTNEMVNQAFTRARKAFTKTYVNPTRPSEFLELCRKAVRKNLSR